MYTNYVEFGIVEIIRKVEVAQMFEKFISELNRQGLSKSTIEGYSFDIVQYFEWLKSKEYETQITKDLLNEYTISLITKYSENTILKKIKSVIRYNRFLYQSGESSIKIEPNEIYKISKVNKSMRIRSLEITDLIRIRDKILEYQNKRDILIFELLFVIGCRISELMNIELNDKPFVFCKSAIVDITPVKINRSSA